MAMQLDGQENQVHIVPCYSMERRSVITGGWYSDADLLIGSRPFPGCQKIQRDPSSFLRLIAMCKIDMHNQEIAIQGSTTKVEVAITNAEAAVMNRSIWAGWKWLATLESLKSCCATTKEERYVLTFIMPTEIVNAATTGIIRCSQERTDINAIGSTPVHTRLDALFERGHDCKVWAVPTHTTQATLIAAKMGMHFCAAMIAEGRALIVGGEGTLPCYDAPEANPDGTEPARVLRHVAGIEYDTGPRSTLNAAEELASEAAQITGPAGVPLEDRLSVAPERELRESIEIVEKDDGQLTYELEKSIKKPHEMPGADLTYVITHVATIGPPLVGCDAPLDTSSMHNEKNGVSRHLAAHTRHEYSDKGKERYNQAADLVEKHILHSFNNKVYYEKAELPQAWGEVLREIAAEEASDPDRIFSLKGMGKSGEIGLPLTKRQRLIGVPGPKEAGALAEWVGLFEKIFKQAYPGFVSKGLTIEEVDERLKCLLEGNNRSKRTLASCDFAAMDSSWYAFEKQRVKKLVENCIDRQVDILVQMVHCNDPTDFETIKWKLKTIVVKIAKEDMILFSGERGTSIYNRLEVLIMRTAEIIRFRGVDAATAFWDKNLLKEQYVKPTEIYSDDGDVDFGDGDDTVFTADDYKDADEIIAAYKCYGKTIEPVISSVALEVLSRYAFLSKEGKFKTMVKMKKNVQRAVYGKRNTTRVEDGVLPDLDWAEHLTYATALYQKCFAAKDTPVVRQLLLMGANYQYSCARAKGGNTAATSEMMTQFSTDDMRRRGDALRHEKMDVLKSRVEDTIQNVGVNGFIMEHWLAFTYGSTYKLPHGKLIEARAIDWKECDQAMAEVVVSEDDIRNCESFIHRCGITEHIAEAMGVTDPLLLKCCSLGTAPATAPRIAGGEGRGVKQASPPKGKGKGERSSESEAGRSSNDRDHPSTGKKNKSKPTRSSLYHAVRSTSTGVAACVNTDGRLLVAGS